MPVYITLEVEVGLKFGENQRIALKYPEHEAGDKTLPIIPSGSYYDRLGCDRDHKTLP